MTRAAARSTGRRRAAAPLLSAGEAWALGLLVLGGLALLPGALDRFVFPKLAVTAAGVALAFRAPARGALPRPVGWLVGAALAVLGVAALAGAHPEHQLIGVGTRYEGLVTLLLYAGAAAAGARLLGPQRPRETDGLLLRLLAWGAIAVAVLAVLETLGLRPLESDVSRPGSLLGNASDQGAWGVLVLGPLLLAAVRAPSRLSVAGATGALLTVALSGSRGALAGAVVVLLVLLVAAAERTARLRLGAVAGALGVLAFALPGVRDRLLGGGLAGETVAGRGALWREALALFAQHPVLGVGPGGFAEAIRGVHTASWYATFGTDNPPDSPHSWPLQALLAGGPLLLALVLALLVLTGRAAGRAMRGDASSLAPGLAAGLAGYGGALLAHFTGPGHTPLAAAFAGGLLATSPARRAARTVAERVVSVAAAAVAVVAALGAVAEAPLRQAVLQLHGDDVAAADDSFSLAATLRPWDGDLDVVAGHAFTVVGGQTRDADVLARAERWLTASGQTDEEPVLADLGAIREARGDLPGAAAALDAALRRDPANPSVLLLRGVVAARQKDWAWAEARFLAAARSAPRTPAPWQDLAGVYDQTGRPGDAAAARARAAALGK